MAHTLQLLVLAVSVSVDAFAAAFGCGVSSVKIPVKSALVMSAVSTGMLLISLLFGAELAIRLGSRFASGLGFGILCILGGLKLCDSWIKALVRRLTHQGEMCFSLWDARFILTVYADPQAADTDTSKELSVHEALPLAAALSADGLAAGLGVMAQSPKIAAAALLVFCINAGGIWLGGWLGKKAGQNITADLTWIGGALLLLLACLKL